MRLFDPLQLGPFELKNRVIMAPLVRARSDENRAPKPIVDTYYAQRSSAGLIITEGCHVSDFSATRLGSSANYTKLQQEAWRRVVSAVHAKGGVIYQQLYHVGRRALKSALPNQSAPLAPSPKAAYGGIVSASGFEEFPVPRALMLAEIKAVIEEFRTAARHAAEAGFDGIEIQGAGGFLLDQFLLDSANDRSDIYGGTLENRARFMLEVIDAVSDVFGADRVGIRLSPHFHADGIHDSDHVSTFSHVVRALDKKGLGYIHLVEGLERDNDQYQPLHLRLVGPLEKGFGPADGEPYMAPLFRKLFSGVLVINSGYTRETAIKIVEDGTADAVAFGRLFISNPDLPERLRRNAPLTEPDTATFYTSGPEGYTDYPMLSEDRHLEQGASHRSASMVASGGAVS